MGKIFVNHISDRGLLSKIYKELGQFNNKQTKNPPNNLILQRAEELKMLSFSQRGHQNRQ